MASKTALALSKLTGRGILVRAPLGISTRVRPLATSSSLLSSSSGDYDKYETLKISRPRDWVFHVQFNRPERRNAMNKTFWLEIGECFKRLNDEADCRSVVLSGAGKMFSAGIDLQEATETFGRMQSNDEDVARKAKFMRGHISEFQQCLTAIEKCSKPVIAAIHGACIGSGFDLICACDIRYCSEDAWFSIKEVDMGLAADVGTLQRLPKIIGNDGVVREWAYTARNIDTAEALEVGLVSKVYESTDNLMTAAIDLATFIASKSPVAVQGSKIVLNYSRDNTVQQGLDFVANWNQTMLQSEDVIKSVVASMSKGDEPAQFSKL